MEIQLLSILLYSLSFTVLIISLKKLYSPKSKTLNLPPGPWRLPIIGCLHHMTGGSPHLVVQRLVKKFGPIMYLKLGQVDFIVTTSREASEEVLKTQDINFAYRPNILFGQILMYDCTDLVFSPYGPYYKQLRRIFLTELLSPKRVKSFALTRKEENQNMVRAITEAASNCGSTGISLREHLVGQTNAILMRTAFGRLPIKRGYQFLALMSQVLAGITGMTAADFFPSLKFLSYLSGLRSQLAHLRKELDIAFDEIVEEHAKMTGKVDPNKEDLLDVLLRLKDEGALEVPLTMENVRAVIIDAFIGGTETSSSVSEWVMAELLKNPKVLERAQEEIRQVIKGKENNLHELDPNELKYLHLVVKETLRLHSIAPILMPRVCQETCQILGYTVPAGTRLLVNAYALMRDTKYWDDPDQFRPERFEGSQVDYKGANIEFLPFGSGRRMCPGMGFGVANVLMAVANLLYYFDWKLPGDLTPKDLDMTEASGAAPLRKNALFLVPVPRYAPPPRN